MDKKLAGACVAELIGTFALTFIGGGAILNDKGGLLGVAVAHGLALATMISAMGHISGGHFNPSVTLGLLSIGKVRIGEAVPYWVSQCGGAVLAGALLKSIFGTANLVSATPHLGATSAGIGILVEAVLTFFLLTAVLGTAVDRNAPKIGGFGIGLTVCMDILMGGPVTGAAMNQARWLGTGLFGSPCCPDALVYLLGPAIGGVAASLTYKALFSAEARA
ncbi:MAG: MIP family channel [Planctomycetota bacterium]|nr:MAG: MIP family channel [Planctomycetota bacterium]